jgi:hypothetical protein
MEYDDREAGIAILRETPEEAARAIASALEFLREEAAALGMRDVSILIGLARGKTRDYCAPAVKAPGRHWSADRPLTVQARIPAVRARRC